MREIQLLQSLVVTTWTHLRKTQKPYNGTPTLQTNLTSANRSTGSGLDDWQIYCQPSWNPGPVDLLESWNPGPVDLLSSWNPGPVDLLEGWNPGPVDLLESWNPDLT